MPKVSRFRVLRKGQTVMLCHNGQPFALNVMNMPVEEVERLMRLLVEKFQQEANDSTKD